jgi:hypothetical protein
MRSILLLIVLISSCGQPKLENPTQPTKQTLATKVRNQTISQLKMERDLYPCGIGSGMMNQIRMLAISFDYYKEVDIDQARELLMAAGTLFLKTINSNKQIHSFLINCPFKPENIEIAIFV